MIKLVKYRTNEGVRSAFVKPSRKWMQVVALDAGEQSGLRVRRVLITEQEYMTRLMRKGRPYPISRALTKFAAFGKTHGITKGAKNLLREAGEENKTTKKDAKAT